MGIPSRTSNERAQGVQRSCSEADNVAEQKGQVNGMVDTIAALRCTELASLNIAVGSGSIARLHLPPRCEWAY